MKILVLLSLLFPSLVFALGGGGIGGRQNGPEVSGTVRSNVMYLYNGGSNPEYSLTGSLADETQETLGATGSGADNIWSALDNLPDNTTAVYISVGLTCFGTSSGHAFLRMGDSTVTLTADESRAQFYVHQENGDFERSRQSAWIPIGSNKILNVILDTDDCTLTTPEVELRLDGFSLKL